MLSIFIFTIFDSLPTINQVYYRVYVTLCGGRTFSGQGNSGEAGKG